MVALSKAKADEAVKLLNEGEEDGCSYQAVLINPVKNWWAIEVFDEDGERLGRI